MLKPEKFDLLRVMLFRISLGISLILIIFEASVRDIFSTSENQELPPATDIAFSGLSFP